jgi:hypothetical protein
MFLLMMELPFSISRGDGILEFLIFVWLEPHETDYQGKEE